MKCTRHYERLSVSLGVPLLRPMDAVFYNCKYQEHYDIIYKKAAEAIWALCAVRRRLRGQQGVSGS